MVVGRNDPEPFRKITGQFGLYCIGSLRGSPNGIGRFQAIKTDVLLIFLFITGDNSEFLSPMMFSNEYITGI